MFTRFNGNVVPFADDSTSTNRTVFGGTTQSDLIDDNLNTNFKKGWEIVGLNDNPTREDFNAMGYTLGALTAYLYEMGISEWNASQNYRANSRVTGSDGIIYKAKIGTNISPNVNNNPIADTTNWGIDNQFYINSLASKATPIDTDNFGIQETGGLFKKLSWANIKATLKTYFDTLYLALTGDQTVGGVKNFTSSPIVPAPTTAFQVSTKGYVDSIISNIQTLPIGAILNGYTIFPNFIVAFGGEFNRADYPKLWAYLQSNSSLVKTQAQWQTEATANDGICGFFSDGNGVNTFRVPNLDKAFLRPDSRGAGSYQEGSYVAGDTSLNYTNATGLVNYDNDDSAFRGRMNWDNLAPTKIGNSNLIAAHAAGLSSYTNSTLPSGFGVTRPKNIAVLPLIVAK